MPRLLLGHCVEIARKLHGNCADTVRVLRGYCAEIVSDIATDAARTNACPLRGYSVDVRRIFGGHECLNEVRGGASTLKPAQNCVGT